MDKRCKDCAWFGLAEAIASGLPAGLAPCGAMPPKVESDGRGGIKIGHVPTHENIIACSFFQDVSPKIIS